MRDLNLGLSDIGGLSDLSWLSSGKERLVLSDCMLPRIEGYSHETLSCEPGAELKPQGSENELSTCVW